MSGSHDDVREHVRTYMKVFGALLVLTVVTVAVASFHLSVPMAITVALVIATTKGSLVATFFMHLLWDKDRPAIGGVLLLTAIFFVALMCLPLLGHLDRVR